MMINGKSFAKLTRKQNNNRLALRARKRYCRRRRIDYSQDAIYMSLLQKHQKYRKLLVYLEHNRPLPTESLEERVFKSMNSEKWFDTTQDERAKLFVKADMAKRRRLGYPYDESVLERTNG